MAKVGDSSGAKELKLPKPKISLSDLIFVMNVRTEANMIALVKYGEELEFGPNDRFHIQFETMSHLGQSKSTMADVKIKCRVVYKDDWEDVVTIFDARRSLDATFGCLINDLVTPQGYMISGLVAYVEVAFKGELLDKIGLQMFLQGDGRYFSLDDTLTYLQCLFLSKN
ncbi:hypothetical protein CARUB_v10003015mg [Capsella rubella]|uniref:Uncharacterized protein n=1 Tax=Capsella rubella TaxID=81985 RepID=R0GZL5_9BRAS|nr:probable F-box protein At5g04010 [Capsella rubella]EOA22379.1 hypothetical protein CARUB_v10003015mg [Capsella rubella]